MSDLERERAILKIGSGNQLRIDLQSIFSAVGYAVGQDKDVRVDQIWLNTSKPVSIQFGDDPSDKMSTEVLDASAARSIADLELDTMLSARPDAVGAHQAFIRDRLGLVPGTILAERDRNIIGGALADSLRMLGGVAIISGSTLEDVAVARDFYEDLRELGHTNNSTDQED